MAEMNTCSQTAHEHEMGSRVSDPDGERSGFQHAPPPAILGSSTAAQAMRDFVRQWADATSARILLTGESGTGKDLVARHLHHRSPRRQAPFVAVNCAGIPSSLAESELFGYQKGAFTGATSSRRGYFELAHGGTLFLDEVAELAPAIQAKLLRVIQDFLVFRVGAQSPVRVDVRIIAATNKNLEQEVGEGRFREDLYSRLRTLEYRLPAVRERIEDVEELAAHFLAEAFKRNGRPPRQLSAAALECLKSYSWPRNVRELEQEMERASIVAQGLDIALGDLDPRIHGVIRSRVSGDPVALEVLRILAALHQVGGSVTAAARKLGVHRTTLWRRMKELGIKKDFALSPPPNLAWLFRSNDQ